MSEYPTLSDSRKLTESQRRWITAVSSIAGQTTFCIAVIALNIVDAVWILFYVLGLLHPYNSNITKIHAAWVAFTDFMYIFGFLLGFINIAFWLWVSSTKTHPWIKMARRKMSPATKVTGTAVEPNPDLNQPFLEGLPTTASPAAQAGVLPRVRPRTRNPRVKEPWTLRKVFIRFIILPFALITIIGPFFAPMIINRTIAWLTWEVGCNGSSMQIVLDAASAIDESLQSSINFYSGKSAVYTFGITQPLHHQWHFALNKIDSSGLAKDPTAADFPSIHNVTYDLDTGSISGYCTSPSSPINTFPCLAGSFDNSTDILKFDVTDLRSNTTSHLRTTANQWVVSHGQQHVVLVDNITGKEIMRTDTIRPGTCTELKMCASVVGGAEVVVPAGFFMVNQIAYGIECTPPPTSTD